MNKKMQETNIKGLSESEVCKRVSEGLYNFDSSPKPKPIGDVFKDNFFTLFNFVNLILAVMIIFTGSLRNLMFMAVVICNSLISLFQELRARSATEKLKLISSKSVKVLRDSKILDILTEKIVLDDIVIFQSGSQIIADCTVVQGSCEIDESLLTGESNLIEKNIGDSLLSGSFVVSGKVLARAVKVGRDTYSAKISRGLKNIKSAQSEIMTAVKKIVKIVSIIIIPVGIPLFINQLRANNFNYSPAALTSCAALIGMIPEGLALLTSSVLAVGATRLAHKKVLAKDIYSVESLARIDIICLDKTGTITEGTFEYEGLKEVKSNKEIEKALTWLTSSLKDENETFKAVKAQFKPDQNAPKPQSIVPFTSQRKLSGAFFKAHGSYIMGSAELIFKDNQTVKNMVEKYSNFRVLAVAHSKQEISKERVPNDVNLLGLVLLKDKIRTNASETIKFFQENNVEVKIISGDSTPTISKIGKMIGIKNSDCAIDARELNSFSEVINHAKTHTIFGRATPEKKREIIKALKVKGHTVAMTGDGVNDVLALKEADCSVAMASGSTAAREISHLILMNSDFSSIPSAVSEGRRAINNIKITSSLFLSKTIYSVILAAMMLIFAIPYPFLPIQMSLINTLTVGIPSFLLAFERNKNKLKGSIFSDIVVISLPSAISVCINLVLCFLVKKCFKIPREIYSSIAVVTTAALGIALLRKICTPMNKFRYTIFYGVILSSAAAVLLFGNTFLMKTPFEWGLKNTLIAILLGAVSISFYKVIAHSQK
ncbi:MAG: HAD-IC family P-type ATPase [Oscillospiraceae bacterium]|nr:HAD-IC family P-type ATPase [Oscillospiraceae bacterium]